MLPNRIVTWLLLVGLQAVSDRLDQVSYVEMRHTADVQDLCRAEVDAEGLVAALDTLSEIVCRFMDKS